MRRSTTRDLGDDRNVGGLPAIAKILHTTPFTVRKWTLLPFDPLRLWRHPSRADNYPFQRKDRLLAWKARTFGDADTLKSLPILVGEEEITAMVDASMNHVHRLTTLDLDPLPVQPKRLRRAGGCYVWAYTDAIRDWLAARSAAWKPNGGASMIGNVGGHAE